ncbi:MAG: deoxyribonuclease IV [Solobacterium sp.]|nr:deoxyribonuclease IV [Solobacterium sp.]
MILGCHVRMTAPDFVEGSVREALSYGADAMMLYTGAPQNTVRRPTAQLHIAGARELMRENHIPSGNLIVHAPYLINPANSVKPEVAELAVQFLNSEAQRTHEIGAKYLILHPGSYTTSDEKTGIRTVISQLNKLDDLPVDLVICLETMAGKGSELGTSFEQLEEILSGLRSTENYGICLDTCHIHDAGYDVRDFDSVLDEFDRIIGLRHLHVIHLNDSRNPIGSHKDRHANIGEGSIGFDALYRIASNRRTESVPKILETPYIGGKPPYAAEIEMLRKGEYDPEKLNSLRNAL